MPVFRIVGVLLTLLGGSVMAGWWSQAPLVVRVLPQLTPMVFNTALCFTLAGIALLLPASGTADKARAAAPLGAALAVIATLVLAEHLLQIDVGIDWPSLHAWLRDGNPKPGRMSAPTAMGFLMAGSVFMLAPVANRPWPGRAMPALVLGTGIVGSLGLAGYLVGARLLFPDYALAQAAVHTAAGLLLLSIGLWHSFGQVRREFLRLIAREDDRIAFAGAGVLVAVALTVGLTLVSAYQSDVLALVTESVIAVHKNRAETIQDLVQSRAQNARIAATRPAVMQNLRVIHAGRDDGSNAANVASVVNSFLKQGFSAITYYDAAGKTVASGGKFSDPVEMSVELGGEDGGELLWSEGFILRHRLSMLDVSGIAGSVVAEQPLTVLTRVSRDPAGRGATWDMGLCVRLGEWLQCFPQRLSPRAFSAPLVNADREELPMTRGLRGESGTVLMRDYRAQNVIAAYGPIAGTGLGLVVKVDTAEVLAPIRGQLPYFVLLMLVLTGAGAWLLRSQVHPLAARLIEANRAKDRFLAAMSHELRTPLNAIIGFTGTLLMKLPGPLNADQEKQLKMVQTSARHLLALINDLLDVAKIEAGKVALYPVSLVCQEVLAEAVAALRPLAGDKGLELLVAVPAQPLVMTADRRALSQILLNLLNNAIKFTDRGSVRVSLGRTELDGRAAVEFIVEDTGIGIRPEDQARLFAAFAQVDSADRRQEGTGLGLYLSQKLAVLLRGRIALSSQYGKGSTFRLLVPER